MKNEAEAAAKWWANELANFTEHDAGDLATNVVMSFASALGQKSYTTEQVEAFEKALTKLIVENLSSGKWYPSIHNDYGLDPVLEEAGKQVGLNFTSFDLPIKTVMWFNEGRVTVSKGYGAPPVDIYDECEHDYPETWNYEYSWKGTKTCRKCYKEIYDPSVNEDFPRLRGVEKDAQNPSNTDAISPPD